ncbi:MAG: YlmC/YmxH family sporulation protein [Clostridiales bacterium]|nr:YlmC/YmxH family sporulation protein [Clostridiales bacterium]
MLNCCVTDLRNKEVINRNDGCRLGNVCDVEVDTCTGHITAIIIFGKARLFGLLGHEDDIRICWSDIDVIGDDTILVSRRPERPSKGKRNNRQFF